MEQKVDPGRPTLVRNMSVPQSSAQQVPDFYAPCTVFFINVAVGQSQAEAQAAPVTANGPVELNKLVGVWVFCPPGIIPGSVLVIEK
jgi:hypothetical protein